jgi:hypothetical protein
MNLLHALNARLVRLRNALAGLHRQVRDGVAGAVGQVVAATVRDAVVAALPGPPGIPQAQRYAPRYAYRDDPWTDELRGDDGGWPRGGFRDDPPDDYHADEPPAVSTAPGGNRWRQALTTAAETLAAFASRGAVADPAWLPVALAASAGALAYWLGPVAGAGIALAGSAFAALRWADGAAAVAQRLADDPD